MRNISPIGDDPEEVLWRQRLEDGHEQLHLVLVFAILLLQQEILVVQDHLRVDVLDEDPERFRLAVDLGITLKLFHIQKKQQQKTVSRHGTPGRCDLKR